jgi:hypothetical protein
MSTRRDSRLLEEYESRLAEAQQALADAEREVREIYAIIRPLRARCGEREPGQPENLSRRMTATQMVIDVMSDGRPRSIKDVAVKLEAPTVADGVVPAYNTIAQAMARLVATGEVERVRWGVYQLAGQTDEEER